MKKQEKKDITYKLVLIGDENVGKTSIINRFKNNKFSEKYEPTLGLDFQTKYITIDNINTKLLLYDTSGQEKFKTLIPVYIKEAKVIILIYDITNEESFINIKKWQEFSKDLNKENALFILVGNKSDLFNRKVSQEEGKKFADNNNYIFKEVSAFTGDGIEDLFLNVLSKQIKQQLLINEKDMKDPEEEKLKFNLKENNEMNKKKKRCCRCFN